MLCLKERGNLVAQAIALDVMATIGDHTLQSLNVSTVCVVCLHFLNCGANASSR